MVGFAESFNISVAAAVALYEAHRQRTQRWGSNGDMDDARRDQVRAVWYAKSVRESRKVIERALNDGYRSAGT
jgi:tRNA (guanosine-2'-O-)-methyltransferase